MSMILCLAFLFNFNISANDDEPIVVTADHFERAYRDSMSSIDLISREQIEQSGADSIIDLLRSRPGLSIPTNGPYGKATSIQIRGADSRHTLVMIDGVRATDVTSISGGSRLEFLGIDQVESIEILRGSQSVLYGSEAIGGVLKITTLKPKKKLSKIKLSYGSYNNKIGSASLENKTELGPIEARYILAAGLQRVDGFSAFNERKSVNPDDDGLKQRQVLAKLSLLKNMHSLLLGIQSLDSDYDYDDASADNKTNVGEYKDFQFYGVYKFERSNFLNTSITYTQKKIDRELSGQNSFGSFKYIYEGEFKRIEIVNKMKLLAGGESIVGLEFEKETVDALDSRLSKQMGRERVASYINHYQKYQSFLFEGGVRVEKYQSFDKNVVFRNSVGYQVSHFTLKGSFSTGFKAPSLYQSFNTFTSSSNLSYEQSKSSEIALLFLNNDLLYEMTAFEINFDNFIDYDSPTNRYVNRGDFLQRGLEFNLQKDLDSFEIDYSFTILNSKNLETGGKLVRRPKYKSAAGLGYTIRSGLKVSGQFDFIGRRDEINNQELPSYWKLGANMSTKIKNFQLQVGVNNIFNREYEEVLDFPARGRNFLVSLSGEWL